MIYLQERQRVIYDEQKKLVEKQAQSKAQLARYEDELARKRMQVMRFLFRGWGPYRRMIKLLVGKLAALRGRNTSQFRQTI